MYLAFLINAALNAIAAKDIKVYARAWATAVALLGSDQAAKNNMAPSPNMFNPEVTNQLDIPIIADVMTGLWIGEYALETSTPAAQITWSYFSDTAARIAQQAILNWTAKGSKPSQLPPIQ